MEKTLQIPRHDNRPPSDILIGGSVIQRASQMYGGKRSIAVIDRRVAELHPELRLLADSVIEVEAGENAKSLENVERLAIELLDAGADRRTFIVAIGGGTVTDLVGFTASTFMRGVEFGFVATSLMAQLDASVGGKNGVNARGVKNLIGTFNQPRFVICDQAVLSTLPPTELRSGMSEALKCGILADPELFDIFYRNTYEQIAESPQLLHEIIHRSITVKAAVVTQDEKEAGLRKTLNLGNTFAHAIECMTDKYNHGEAVSIGLSIVNDLSHQLGTLSNEDHSKIGVALKNLGLPLTPPLSWHEMIQAAKGDKKRVTDQALELILIQTIGNCAIQHVTYDQLLAYGTPTTNQR